MDAPSPTLPNDVDALQSLATELSASVTDLQSLLRNKELQIQKLQEQLNLNQHQRYGASSEKQDIQQMEWDFFNEAELLKALDDSQQDQPDVEVASHKRRGRQKKPFPKKLPRVEVVHDLSDAQQQCSCGQTMQYIGDDVSEQLAIIPKTYYVIKHIRRRYGCSCKACLRTADMPSGVLPGTQASAQIIAHTLVSKHLDGLPLYRQEKMAARDKVSLPRAKLARWSIGASERYFEGMYQWLQKAFWQYDISHSDETGIQVLKEEGRSAKNKSWLWLRRGGPPDREVILVDYSPSRSGEVAGTLLEYSRGYLICDAYAGYNRAVREHGLLTVYCNDHARRRFKDIVNSLKKDHDVSNIIATRALAWYKPLYALEKQIKELDADEKYQHRQARALPHWREFLAWTQKLINDGVQHDATREALQYVLNQAEGLMRYCEDGRLPISNIKAEHVAKTIAVARKNFLFADTPAGAKASAMTYSVLETAKLHGHHPFEYTTVLLNELASVMTRDVTKKQLDDAYERLLPWNIAPAEVRAIFKTYPTP